MNAVVIEHVKPMDLPTVWLKELSVSASQTLRVIIVIESSTPEAHDPAFGMWRDRTDLENVNEYVATLRQNRF